MNGVGDLSPGTQIGPYRIVRRIGAGGMGVVYEAFDDVKRRKIALKIVLPNALVNDNAVERFRAEGRALARVNHPNVVSLYELVEHEGLQVLAMEFLEGEPLDLYLLDHPCGMSDIIDILRQVAEGLKAAHSEKIIHRDLKPANVLISTSVNFAGNMQRTVKLIDFGISKIQADPNGPKTATDVILGTANYIAPEVLLGADATPTTDIYSLGLLYWQILTGRVPFEGRTNVDVVRRIMNENLEMPARIDQLLSPSLRHVFKKMTARDHRARYANLDELLADLSRLAYEPMPEALHASIPVPIVVTNQNEIRSRLKLQGFEPIEISFIMKLALELNTGPMPKINTTSAAGQADFPETALKEPQLVKAVERYKQLRAQSSIPSNKPEAMAPPMAMEPPRLPNAPAARSLSAMPEQKPRRFESYGSWMLIVGVVVLAGVLMARVVNKKYGSSSGFPAPAQSTNLSSRSTLSQLGAAVARMGSSPLIEVPLIEAPFPNVSVGDAYSVRLTGETFDAEKIEKLQTWRASSLTGDRVVWESDDKFSKLAFTNPFLSSIRILNVDSTSGKLGEKAGSREDIDPDQGGDIEGDAREPFPLELGKTSRFWRVVHEGSREISRSEFNCLVQAREVVRIEMGSFDTFKVICESTGPRGTDRATFWYSPLAERWLKSESETIRAGGSRAWRRVEVLGFKLKSGNTLRAATAPSL